MNKYKSRRYVDLTGQKFYYLTVVKEVEATYNKFGNRILNWLCQCECGREKIICGSNLKNGGAKSCGCKKREITREKMKAYSERVHPFSVEKNLYGHYKVGAKHRNLSFEISFDYFKDKIKERCVYCNREPYTVHKSKPNSQRSILYNGLDRVDNTKGYEENNLATCCKECNFLKGTFSHEQFLNLIRRIYEFTLMNVETQEYYQTKNRY